MKSCTCLKPSMDQLDLVNLEIPVDEKWLTAAGLEPKQAEREFRLLLAAKLFELGRLSSGAAAELAGIPRTVFMSKLANYGVATFRQSAEELKEDLRRA